MFFQYTQNNSGGHFDVDSNVAHFVIIEADSAREANERASEIGLYFDGEGDCDCCGNRWHEAFSDEDGDSVPSIYGDHVETFESYSRGDIAIVHFACGTKMEVVLRYKKFA
jgi:hypothetical protein